MTQINTFNKVIRILATIGIALGVIFLYAILHEGGHALFVLLFGGEVTEFEVNFLTSKPHISYTGIDDPMKRALISLGGPLMPLVLIPLLILSLRKTRNVLARGITLLVLINLLPTIIISAVICLAYGFGSVSAGEDLAKFLSLTGVNPFMTAGVFILLFAAYLALAIKVGKAKEAAITVINALRETPANSQISPAVRALITILILAAAVGIIRNAVTQDTPAAPPLTYHTKLEVNLEEISPGSAIFHKFAVDQPTVFDFVYSLQTTSEITLQLVNLEGKPLLASNEDTMVMYRGSENLRLARFTGFTLLPGEYGLEISPGSRGSLTMYIDSREPNPADQQYLQLLELVHQGTFTAESYQEEGYELIFQGELSPGLNQTLAAVPSGPELLVSAFAIGEGEVSLFYVADEIIHLIMQGFRATIGRSLPAHKSNGEFRASVNEAPVTLYIYIKR